MLVGVQRIVGGEQRLLVISFGFTSVVVNVVCVFIVIVVLCFTKMTRLWTVMGRLTGGCSRHATFDPGVKVLMCMGFSLI